jgi:hypothetical protein
MADEYTSSRVGGDSFGSESLGTKEQGTAASHKPATPADESIARGVLRDAITKVMEEIQLHEREARRHLKLAEVLKRDLRESFAFLQERGGGRKRAEAPAASSSATGASEQAEEKPAAGSPASPRQSTRKRRRGRKGKKA